MFCQKCKKDSSSSQEVCVLCGTPYKQTQKFTQPGVEASKSHLGTFKEKRKKGKFGVIRTIGVIGLILFSIYTGVVDQGVDTNNETLENYETSESQTAINKLNNAVDEAATDENKINTLNNLAYIQINEGQYQEALELFQKALTYTTENSFDYYLINGEIALINNQPDLAKSNYLKANELRPNDFSSNNALNLFYLDLNDQATEYTDYSKALNHAIIANQNADEYTYITASQNLGIAYYFNDQYYKAIEEFQKTDLENDPIIAYWLGWSYVLIDNYEEASNHFQLALDGGIELDTAAYEYLSFEE